MPRTIVLTGASDGIGAAAARRLVGAGHHVVLVGRSAAKTEAVAAELDAPFFLADFAELAQVRRLAADLLAAHPRIDVLANNAGGIMGERELTVDRYEKTFQVNHLAPFLLTELLLPALVAGRATVIQTASRAAQLFSRFDVDDLQNAHRYAAHRAYGNAKLANILFTQELQRRYGGQGLSAVAFHPGVVGTSFAGETNHVLRHLYRGPLRRLFTVSPDKGADQLVRFAEGTPGTTFQPGAYYEGHRIAAGISREATDPRVAHELWERSAALV